MGKAERKLAARDLKEAEDGSEQQTDYASLVRYRLEKPFSGDNVNTSKSYCL
jgi:hypothetical protein